MRVVLRVALVAVLVAGLAVVALALALPRIVGSEQFRSRVESYASRALGRDIEYGEVGFGLLPPRVEVADVRVAGARYGEPPAVEAASLSLSLAWRPLLSGRAVIRSLEVDGASLRVVRDEHGIDLLGLAPLGGPAQAAADEGPDGASAPVALSEVAFRRASIEFVDRVARPPTTWRLVGVDADVRGATDGSGALDFEADGTLEGRGAFALRGRQATSAGLDARLDLSDFELAPLAAYSPALSRLQGPVDARIALQRTADAALHIDVSASGAAIEAEAGDLRIGGGLEASVELSGTTRRLSGPFSVDASGAALDYGGGIVRKPAGTPGRVEGSVRIENGRVEADYEVRLRNLEGRGTLRSAPQLHFELSAPAFDAEGWEEIVPGLAGYALGGSLAVDALRYGAGARPRLGGAIVLAPLRLRPLDGASPFSLDGRVQAEGERLVLQDMSMTVGAARIPVEGGVADLFGSRRAEVRARTPEPIESNTFFSFFDSLRDTIFGALTFEVDVLAPLGAGAGPLLEALRGGASFEIGGDEQGGRLAGVSLLRSVFDESGGLGEAALVALPARRGKPIDAYYSEHFNLASGRFDLADGRARTNDLRIVYEQYEVRLRGAMGLADLSLDMTGEIRIGPEIDATLAGGGTGKVRVLPLAHVVGSLRAPRISLRSEDVVRFASYYALGSDTKVGRKIDRALGAGASDLLRDLLGGGKAPEGE